MNNSRVLTIAVIGLTLVLALSGAVVLLYQGKPGGELLAVATTALGILTPSPLSKTATAVDVDAGPAG